MPLRYLRHSWGSFRPRSQHMRHAFLMLHRINDRRDPDRRRNGSNTPALRKRAVVLIAVVSTVESVRLAGCRVFSAGVASVDSSGRFSAGVSNCRVPNSCHRDSSSCSNSRIQCPMHWPSLSMSYKRASSRHRQNAQDSIAVCLSAFRFSPSGAFARLCGLGYRPIPVFS